MIYCHPQSVSKFSSRRPAGAARSQGGGVPASVSRLLFCCSLLLVGCGGSTEVFPCVYAVPSSFGPAPDPVRKETFTQGQPAMVCVVNPPNSTKARLNVDVKPVDNPSDVHTIEIDSALSATEVVSNVRYQLPADTPGEFLIELTFNDKLIAESKYVVKAK